jgi:hypothetical protein
MFRECFGFRKRRRNIMENNSRQASQDRDLSDNRSDADISDDVLFHSRALSLAWAGYQVVRDPRLGSRAVLVPPPHLDNGGPLLRETLPGDQVI